MLVQLRHDTCRLIRQHEHGLAAGAMAGAWRGGSRPDGLPPATVVATALHDVVWREEDHEPRLDPERRIPHDFTSLPPSLKEPMVARGLEALEAVDPDVAGLVRAHHQALSEGAAPPPGEARWVRFLDILSLRILLTPPDADPETIPEWLIQAPLVPPGAAGPLAITWNAPTRVALDPFPFPGPALVLQVPFRELSRRSFADSERLRSAWSESVPSVWTLEVTGP